MKFLLFGADGQLGWQLQRSLAPLGEVVALMPSSPGGHGDFSQPAQVAQAVRAHRPDVIVNAAAYTAVDRAEQDEEQAFAINAGGCELLAREAAALDAWLVHYSTDYVFDGSGTRPWRDDDAPAPLNAYGRSKLAGEQAVSALCRRHLVIRTSWLFETWGANFASTILRLARERDTLEVVDDQWGAPTRAAGLADVTAHIVRQLRPAQAGIYHAAAAGATSWHGFAAFLLARAREQGMALRTPQAGLRAVASSHFAGAARRPANSRLDCTRLREQFGLALPPWESGAAAVVAELAQAWRVS